MFTAEVRTHGLEKAIERLAAWNEARYPVIRKAANRARARIRAVASGFFEFRVDQRRRGKVKKPFSGTIQQFPDRLILTMGSKSKLVAYHELGKKGPAEAGRRQHRRRGAQVRAHPLRLNIPQVNALDGAVKNGAQVLMDDISFWLRETFGGRRA